MKRIGVVATLLGLLGTGSAARAQVEETKRLKLEGARLVARAAATEARRLGAGGAIAVVDDGGHVLFLERLDGTFPAAAPVAIEKARTAATFRRATRVFEDAIKNGRTSLVAVDVMTPLQGGVPILVGEHVVGGVGVSGAASAQQDEDIAVLASKALETGVMSAGEGEITYLPGAEVKKGFAKGAVLVDHGNYMVHASHREAPGQAEVHSYETDIIYVLSGKATFVTGGSVVDGKTVSSGEIRGPSISGGSSRQLAPGDVIVVPNGTPHWFREIEGTFDYYVVKVRDEKAGVS
jgi:glc operon protein GlcG